MGLLARLAAAHGVLTSYEFAPGQSRHAPDGTVIEVLGALGVDATTPHAVRAALDAHLRRRADRLLPPTVGLRVESAPPALRASGHGVLSALPPGTVLVVDTEQGDRLDWDPAPYLSSHRTPPADDRLPLGYHTLRATSPDGRSAQATLIVAPDRLPEPTGRDFGLLVQLYSVLSARSWGMGDLGDLADLAGWAGRSLGAGFIQLNPLHSAVPRHPGEPTDPSPYRPSSRRFADPVHLRVEDVPEYAYLAPADRERATELLGQAASLRDSVLRKGAHIDRDAVWELKRQALELVRAVPLAPGRRAAYCDFLADQGQALEDHATWCALAELHGPDWTRWPQELRDPRSPRTARARSEQLDRVDFHSWLLWLTDAQLAAAQGAARSAGMGVGLVHDLAVGVHPTGSDAWAQQSVLAAGMSVGAPPDAFNPHGQDWGLPPWRPDALAEHGYAPYRDLLRGALRHAGAARLDHVMGLFRLWWVPRGRPSAEGCYVRYDAEAMLSVLALEAHRAGAMIIGEDLGTVEPGVRRELAGRGVLGTSVLWFERDYPVGPAAPEEGDSVLQSLSDLETLSSLEETLSLESGPDPDGPPLPHGVPAAERQARLEPVHGLGSTLETGVLDPGTPPSSESVSARELASAGDAPPARSAPGPERIPTPASVEGAARGDSRAPAPPLAPEDWRASCLATVTTHDLPSTAARLTGEHVELRHRLGLLTRSLAIEQTEDSIELAEWLSLFTRLGLLPEGPGNQEAEIKAAYRFLSRTPAQLVGVWLPDAVGDLQAQNVPGTVDEYPNWRLPVTSAEGEPTSLEELVASPRLHALLDEVRRGVRGED